MSCKWTGAVVVLLGAAIAGLQPALAKPTALACDIWKSRLKAETAKTKLLPPIDFENTQKITFEITGMDDIDVIADCKDGHITSLNGTIRGRSEITALRWTAFSMSLAKTFDLTLSAAQVDKRINAMAKTAKKQFVEGMARGNKNAQGSGLGEFGSYEMTFDMQDGWIGISAHLIEEDE